MTGQATREAHLSESAYQRRIIDAAAALSWRVAHFRPARTAHGWRTPLEGHAGLPDLVLAKGGSVILVEVKSERGTLTTGQVAWLDQLGDHGRLWKPQSWPEVLAELRGEETP
jgi:hypothetical protein